MSQEEHYILRLDGPSRLSDVYATWIRNRVDGTHEMRRVLVFLFHSVIKEPEPGGPGGSSCVHKSPIDLHQS